MLGVAMSTYGRTRAKIRRQSSCATADRIDHHQVERGGDTSPARLLQQLQQRFGVLGQQRRQQRRIAEVQDVDSVQIHLASREGGVGPGVVPERPVLPSRLEDQAVRGRRPGGGGYPLGADALLSQQSAGDLAQRVVPHRRADSGRHPGGMKGERRVGHTPAQGEPSGADLVEPTGFQSGGLAQLRRDIDAEVSGDSNDARIAHWASRMTSPA